LRRFLALTGVAAALATSGAGLGSTERPLRVGYVAHSGSRQDKGVGQAGYEAFRGAVLRLGLTARVLEVRFGEDPTRALATLARQRYDLIVTAAVGLEAIASTAIAFPKVKFLVSDVPHASLEHRPKNVQTFVLRVEEAGYLTGYLAALMEKRRPGKDVIGSVGGYPIPQVDTFIAGYRAGARQADPGIRTLNGYSRDFTGPAKCRAVALGQISRGAGVVFNVAGRCGLGTLDAAKQKHVWGIGVDIDQSFLGPHILTSAVKRYDVAILSELTALRNGTFRTGGTTFLGLKENGVALGRISAKVPREFVRELNRVRARIVAGKIRVPARLS
jgi:basic membrane protein A and related proteins